MPYITYNDLIGRYAILSSYADSASEVTSHLIHYSEVELNARMGPFFTVPFSPVPLSIMDITMDLCWCKSLRYKDPEKAKDVCPSVNSRIGLMIDEGVVTDSGTVIEPDASETISDAWSMKEDYYPTHTMLDAEDSDIDPDLIDDLFDEREY
jgi:hypothetical protein